MNRKRYVIGIDPDLERSGLAVWDEERKEWVLAEALENWLIPEKLQTYLDDSIIYLEAGWLVYKSNYHGGKAGVSDTIARKVGINQGVGITLEGTLKHLGFQVQEVTPLKKGMLKQNGKWTDTGKDFIKRETGITGKINDEVRDACLLVIWFRRS